MSDVIVYRVMLDCVKEFCMVAYSRLNEAGALDVRRPTPKVAVRRRGLVAVRVRLLSEPADDRATAA